MLHGNLDGSSFKRWRAREPLVNDHPKGILVTGSLRPTLQLLRSQIARGACHLLCHDMRAVFLRMGSEDRQPKVTEQNITTVIQQHIFGLDIAVDKVLVVGILQG